MIRFSDRHPFVSVIMPVYNGEPYLHDSIRSILNQSFYDFEFIIIDDGSSDESVNVINDYRDSRIVLIRNNKNLGNYHSRNIGRKVAHGKYLCVMDADDISDPERLSIQVHYLEKNKDVGICGTFITNIPSNISPRFITEYDHLKVAFLSNNFCSHPSLMMRREYLERNDLIYDERYYYSADYDLCARGCRLFKIVNIPEVLLKYRRHSSQISSAKINEQKKYADMIRIKQLTEILGFSLSEIPISLHLSLMKNELLSPDEKDAAQQWFNHILKRNRIENYYNQIILDRFLSNLILNACRSHFMKNQYDSKLMENATVSMNEEKFKKMFLGEIN